MRKWRIEDSEELYNITGWGTSYFGINDKGHVVVTPRKDGVGVDLKELVDELQLRDVMAPMLVRFPDILDNRIEKISCCFRQAAEEYGYKAENFIIYPIKVNQMRPVVEEIISHGKKFFFTFFVISRFCHLTCNIGITFEEIKYTFQGNCNRFIKYFL